MKDLGRLTRGLCFEDLAVGTTWHSAGRGLVRTRNLVSKAGGETVLVYRPQRLMKLRANQGQT